MFQSLVYNDQNRGILGYRYRICVQKSEKVQGIAEIYRAPNIEICISLYIGRRTSKYPLSISMTQFTFYKVNSISTLII